MKFNVQQYFEISTIHGLVYITKRYHIIERIFWIIFLLFSVICTSILINELVLKIINFPIVVYLSDQAISASEIDFPAVTVCPHFIPLHVYATRKGEGDLYYYYEKHKLRKIFVEDMEWNQEFVKNHSFIKVTYKEIINLIKKGTIKAQKLNIKQLKRLQVVDLLSISRVFSNLNISIPTDNFMDILNEFEKEFEEQSSVVFYWLGTRDRYISEIITQWGLCYTYNIAPSRDVLNLQLTSDDFHYQLANRDYHLKYTAVPSSSFYKTISTSKVGLWIGFEYWKRDNMLELSMDTTDGHLVLIHNINELPSIKSRTFVHNNKKQTDVWIQPLFHAIDESLFDYQPVERNCYLEDEKVLKFFKVYTKNNCEQECLSNFMLSRCGCVEFFMIRNSTTRICSANEEICYNQAKEDFENEKGFCECFNSCFFVDYDVEKVEFGYAESNVVMENLGNGFQVQYKYDSYSESVRKKQFNELDFLSFVGGILGLFAGFSVLSFVELFYWFTIRVFVEKFSNNDSQVYPIVQEAPTKISKIKESVLIYLNESSIHGIGHIFRSSYINGIIWTIFTLIVMSGCIHLISSAHEKVPDSRVIAYDDSYVDTYQIPFPAFTFVPQKIVPMRILNSNFFEYSVNVNSKKTLNALADKRTGISLLRDLARYNFCTEWYSIAATNYSYIPYLIDILKEDSEVDWFRDQFSLFNGKYQPEYAEIRTTRGMGFTFNMIAADEMLNFDQIGTEFNYTKNVTTKSENLLRIPLKPPMTFNRHERVELQFKIVKPTGIFWPCVKQSFIIHKSEELPTFNKRKNFKTVEYGMSIDVSVTAEITRTDSNLKKLPPSNRECYFQGEKSLKYFKIYTQKNCDIECLTNITQAACKCVQFDQPFKNSSEMCLQSQGFAFECFTKLQRTLYELENFSPYKNCSCFPLCNSVDFNIQYFFKRETKGNETAINVKMNMDDIILYRRYQQFTFSDVVSYVGGLLGLFAGISMLSIVEFFYFFTIRLGVNLWRGLKLGDL